MGAVDSARSKVAPRRTILVLELKGLWMHHSFLCSVETFSDGTYSDDRMSSLESPPMPPTCGLAGGASGASRIRAARHYERSGREAPRVHS